MTTAISVSYCADHSKGPCYRIDPAEHLAMLRGTVLYLKSQVDWPIIICANGCTLDAGREIMRMFPSDVTYSFDPENHGYADGALWAIREAIEAAHDRCGTDYLIHLCEDVVPFRGVLLKMSDRLESEKLDYIGGRWRDDELSTQFFGCRVSDWLYDNLQDSGFDLPPEAYMATLMRDRPHAIIEKSYHHTHTFADYQKFLQEESA